MKRTGKEIASHSELVTKPADRYFVGGVMGRERKELKGEIVAVNSCNYKLGNWAWKHLL